MHTMTTTVIPVESGSNLYIKQTLTVPELAEILGWHEETVYQHLRSGRIPARRMGRRYLISRDRITEWLRDERVA